MNRSIDLQKGTKSAVCGPSQKLPSTPLEIVMMIGTMSRLFRICAACLALACATWPAYASGTTAKSQPARPGASAGYGLPEPGASCFRASLIVFRFTCRKIGGATTEKKWPIILFLHGRGERGSEGMWQTQIGDRRSSAQSSRPLAVCDRDAAVPADRSLDRSRHA